MISQVKQRARKIKEGRQRRETEEANSKIQEKMMEEAAAADDEEEKRKLVAEDQREAARNIVQRRSRRSEATSLKNNQLNQKEVKRKENHVNNNEASSNNKRIKREVGGSRSREVNFLISSKASFLLTNSSLLQWQVTMGDNARQFWDSSDSSTLRLSHSALPTAAQARIILRLKQPPNM